MAPKQPDWTFLESLSPDDLEDDDTEKVSVTKSSIYSMSIQTTQLDAEGPFSFLRTLLTDLEVSVLHINLKYQILISFYVIINLV